MCVAAVIFGPVSLEDHEAMESSNPHGGGVAWFKDGRMAFHRGLTAKEIYEMQESGVMSYPYLLHYRWATHGAKVSELTHPFPVGVRALFGELSGVADRVLIHNGTWSGYEMAAHRRGITKQFGTEMVEMMSDTAIAAYIAETEPSILDDVPWATCLAFVDENGALDVRTTGQWSERQGSWYSNLSWERSYDWEMMWSGPYHKPYKTVSHSLWDDAEGEVWDSKYGDNRHTEAYQPKREVSWEEYMLAKYGTDADFLEALQDHEPNPDNYEEIGDYLEACFQRNHQPELVDTADIVSEDPTVVNKYLEGVAREAGPAEKRTRFA